MSRPARPLRSVMRNVAGVRCEFVYDDRANNVDIRPDCDNLRDCDTDTLLRFWATIGEWVQSLLRTHPGWTIDGEHPIPDPDREPEEPDG